MKQTVEMFSFGYEGWGSETKLLVKGIDAVEEARGYGPPFFIDTRIRREVRAIGFRGNAFGNLVGDEPGEGRYIWDPRLGNDSILTGEREVSIHDPSAAADVIDLALRLALQQRRLVFFCHCPIPAECHRSVVADLLLDEAARRGIDLGIAEWPGGEPISISTSVSRELLGQVRRGRRSVPIARVVDLPKIAGLPWGSAVNAKGPGGSVWVSSGPARVSGGKWQLPVYGPGPFDSETEALEFGRELRAAEGLDARRSKAMHQR